MANKLADLLMDDTILCEDREIYVYGIHQICLFVLNVTTTILIGVVFGMIGESILFMITYIPIRIYAGGYHAKTPMRCYLLSVVMMLFVLQIINMILWTEFICFEVFVCANLMIAILAPVEDRNKPLSKTEKAVYRKHAYIMLGILDLIILFCWAVEFHYIAVCISVTLAIQSVMLVMGKLKNVFNISQRPREMLE